jgi:hypothetical protein
MAAATVPPCAATIPATIASPSRRRPPPLASALGPPEALEERLAVGTGRQAVPVVAHGDLHGSGDGAHADLDRRALRVCTTALRSRLAST